MGIELPPELADVAAQAGVVWPEADEDAMARQAQAWRDTATSMATLATDADTTARSALSSVAGDAGDAAAKEWRTFVEADSGHLTSVIRDANAAADRLEHAADQVGTAKVEIVRNLVSLAQNADAAHVAASAGHPTALAGLDTAVRGTAANVAHIESQLVSAVRPASGVDMAAVQNPVNANPGHHLLPGVTTTVADVTSSVTGAVTATVDQAADTAAQLPGDVARPAADLVGDTADTLRQTPGHVVAGDVLPDRPGDPLPGHEPGVVPGHPGAAAPGDLLPGRPGDAVPGDVPPADPDVTGPVPSDTIDDTPTPPTGQTVQAGFAGSPVPAAAPPPNLPPAAAPPLASPAAPPAYGGGPFAGAPAAPVGGAPAPVPAPGRPVAPIPAAPAPAAPAPVVPAPVRSAPAAYTPAAVPADRPPDPAPRAGKPMAGPPGAPPPARGERNEVLAAFWIHMFPIGHLPVASYKPARQVAAPPPELDYAAGLRFEPADHPDFHLVDDRPRLAELHEGIAHRAATKAAAEAVPAPLPPPSTPPGYQSYAPPSAYQYPAQPAGYPPLAHPAQQVGGGMSYTGLGQHGYPPPAAQPPTPAPPVPAEEQPAEAEGHVSPDAATIPRFRPVNPSAGITADHPTVQSLVEGHDPLGGANEREWDRRYLVRLGSVTPQGISPEGLEYNWPTSEQYPEGGSAPGEPETLAEDTVIDRFGPPHGRVFAADSTTFARRSLPPAYKDAGYRRYRVRRPLPVWRAVSAAWFGQPGGGVRYRTTHSAIELVALGYLEEIA